MEGPNIWLAPKTITKQSAIAPRELDGSRREAVDQYMPPPLPDSPLLHMLLGWRHGVMVSNVGWINEVNHRRARLVLGWVTIFRWETI